MKQILIYFFTFLLFNLNAQEDSTAVKTDSILTILVEQVLPYLEAENAKNHREHQDSLIVRDRLIVELQNELAKIKEDATNSSEQLATVTKERDELQLKLRDAEAREQKLLTTSKSTLEAEIKALRKQGFEISEALLNSMMNRLSMLGDANKPKNEQELVDFIEKKKILDRASKALNSTYSEDVAAILSDMKSNFGASTSQTILLAEKKAFEALLRNYCAKTKELVGVLEFAADLNAIPTERDNYIDSEIINYIKYDYLLGVLLKNKADHNANPLANIQLNCN